MTTDAFTTAARAEAIRWWTTPQDGTGVLIEDLGAHMAEWARDHLARQEPTDAEVEAVADAIRDWVIPGIPRELIARAALTAAKGARA